MGANKLIRILFVCHGNICRSPMAEFIMRQLVAEAGLSDRFFINSKATSSEELGNAPYPLARKKLKEKGIRVYPHTASRISASDYDEYDYLIGMDSANIHNMSMVFGDDPQKKIFRLRDFCTAKGDIADPWYTGDFDTTFNQIYEGCSGLLSYTSNFVS